MPPQAKPQLSFRRHSITTSAISLEHIRGPTLDLIIGQVPRARARQHRERHVCERSFLRCACSELTFRPGRPRPPPPRPQQQQQQEGAEKGSPKAWAKAWTTMPSRSRRGSVGSGGSLASSVASYLGMEYTSLVSQAIPPPHPPRPAPPSSRNPFSL